MTPFQQELSEGIPSTLPAAPVFDTEINRAPKRKDILSNTDKKLAIRNALRYFPTEWHDTLAPEFLEELNTYGRIYMYRFMPKEFVSAKSIQDYPGQSEQAKSIMLMIQNNLDPKVAQHPYELITYGGNGAVFQNWAQYSLVMKYLAEMTDDQTLVMYSGHPMGLFPSNKNAPRVVVTNGMMIPNYSKPDDWEKFNALGVTQYGQMTAGSFMYIGPQGIVHGTTITVLNAARMKRPNGDFKGLLFVTSGLGGMSGAQPKAAKIAGLVSVTAEVNPKAAYKRQEQGWVDIVIEDIDELVTEVELARKQGKDTSFAYLGNIVDVWEGFEKAGSTIDFGSDQTSLHNPFAGGYYPVGMSYEDANHMMAEQPERFKDEVYKTLRRHAEAINKQTKRGTYFFDYGNAFLLEAGRAGADVFKTNSKDFKYPSYVQDIMGPLCFDYGFGPFRWVCASGKSEDLDKTDSIAAEVIEQMLKEAPADIKPQLQDNLHWVKEAKKNKLVVGSQARILYADAEGRMRIAAAFNKAIRNGEIGPVVLGRDHHDVSGTDSPYRETSNIYDGSQFTADMAVQNFVGDAFRGATWVSLHNGGGVGWGEVINGGFGMLLDGSKETDDKLKSMLFWDVNNGIARRNWARNPHAMTAIDRAMEAEPKLKVTKPNLVGDDVIDNLFTSP